MFFEYGERITIKQTDSITVKCMSKGIPFRNIYLKLNDTILDNFEIFDIIKTSERYLKYEITEASRMAHNGDYKCIDGANNVTKTMRLIVQSK